MTKAWRIVGWIVLSLLVAGVVLAGAGWLTGASLPRIADMAFGSADAAKAAGQDVLEQLTGLWKGFLASVRALF